MSAKEAIAFLGRLVGCPPDCPYCKKAIESLETPPVSDPWGDYDYRPDGYTDNY